MHWLKHSWLATLLLFAVPAHSADPGSSPRPEDYARKCEFHANNRWHGTQGRMLVGSHCAWTKQGCKDARDSVLAWASAGRMSKPNADKATPLAALTRMNARRVIVICLPPISSFCRRSGRANDEPCISARPVMSR